MTQGFHFSVAKRLERHGRKRRRIEAGRSLENDRQSMINGEKLNGPCSGYCKCKRVCFRKISFLFAIISFSNKGPLGTTKLIVQYPNNF